MSKMQSLFKFFRVEEPQRIRTREPPKPHELGLQTLYRPNGDAETLFDIVAIHGIGAHPFFSWQFSERISAPSQDESHDVTRKREVHWLKDEDMLPQACPDARIMTFGYESQWFGDGVIKQKLSTVADGLLRALRSDRRECPMRPLLFIGHCFGGLVIQKALLVARLQEHTSPGIFSSTCGVVFMGTPHRGTADITSQGMMYAIIAQEPECFIDPSVLEALRTESDTLTSVRKEFVDLCKHEDVNLALVCFYEQKITSVGRIIGNPGMKEFVVDATSGSIDGFPSYGLGLDHFSLNKFSGPDDYYYKSVRDEIQGLMRPRLQEMTLRTEDSSHDRLDCLESLAFEDMDKLELGSPKALEGTCNWLFDHWIFRSWSTRDCGTLWILGGPGTGKSTLMKTMYLRLKKDYACRNVAVIGFSFTQSSQLTQQSSNHGDNLPWSSVGLYRSLLHQIFSQSPHLLAQFLPHYRKKRDTRGTKWKWHDEELRDHFVEAATGSEMKSIFVFIDALDECQLRTASEIVSQLKDAVRQAGRVGGRLRICFSNRLHPDLSKNSPHSIRVEKHNNIDIEKYVSEKLFKVSKGKNSGAYQRLGNEIPRRAKGVFLWVALVVEILNEKYEEGGYSPKKMTDMLQSVPDGLHPLFKRIIKKIKKDHLRETVQILRWVLYASRPLTLTELRYAMGFENGHGAGQRWKSQSEFEDSDTPPYEDMEKIIRSRTAGLIEVSHPEKTAVVETPSFDGTSPRFGVAQILALDPDLGQDLEKAALDRNTFRQNHIPTHQFLDEDVSEDSDSTDSSYENNYDRTEDDFDVHPPSSKKQYVQFFHHSAREFFRSTGLQILGNSTPEHDGCKSHVILSRVCVNYLRVEELRNVKSEAQDCHSLNTSNRTPMKKLFRRYPLLHYAIHSWIKHAEHDTSSGESSAGLIEDFVSNCQTLDKSILKYWIGQCKPGHFNMEVEADVLPSLLYISAAMNLPRSVDRILKMCRDHHQKISSALHVAMYLKNTEIVNKLLHGGADVNSKGMNGRTPLVIATQENDRSTIKLLIEKGADLEHSDDEGTTALLHAAKQGNAAVVSDLLYNGASCNYADNAGRTALYYAAAQKNDLPAVKLLIEKGAELEHSDDEGTTALLHAVKKGNAAIVSDLLYSGALCSYADNLGRTALYYAAAHGLTNSVVELLRAGANPNTQDINKATPLHAAVASRKKEVVQLLLKSGADISIRDSSFLTPLSKAIKERLEMAQAMLQTCIEMIRHKNRGMSISLVRALTSTTHSNDTPLHLLVSRAHISKADDILKDVTVASLNAASLLEKIGDHQDSTLQILSQARNEDGNTVLDLAMSTDDSQLVQLLQESLVTANRDHQIASWPTGKHHRSISHKRSYTRS